MVTGVRSAENILFDLDGTLAASLPMMKKVYYSFAKLYGFEGSDAEFTYLNGPSLKEIVKYLQIRYSLDDKYENLFEAYSKLIHEEYVESVMPVKGSYKLLEFMENEGKKMFLVTSSGKKNAQFFLKKYGLSSFFYGYVFGDDVAKAKPDGEIYRLTIEKFSLDVKKTMVFEDSINGVLAAREAALGVIAIGSDSKSLKSAGAFGIYKDLKEFCDEYVYV
jgi:HAD superfamily hydrolase (TIGR01509 family)